MEIVKEPRKNIALIWRRAKPKQTVYRPMRFLLKAQIEDGLLLYNIVTSEILLLNKYETDLFDNLPAEYNKDMDELIARHYLVAEDFNENKSVHELRAVLRKLTPTKRVNGFTILPTTDCNARCYYCFESDFERCTMTGEIANDVVEYIAKMCGSEPIQIGWFGGEPLVGKNRITQICAGLEKKGIKFKSSMVSNAYLFDEDLIITAKNKWNLTGVQITLDGTEEVYNESKAYINPKDNPYKRVLRNIESLLDNGLYVNVRLNVTDKNAADLSVLIDELSDKFSRKKGFSCYSHAVYEDVGFKPLEYGVSVRDSIDYDTVSLDKKLQKKGLLGSYARLPSLRVYNCMSDNDSSRLIYPDGKIGKCENRSSLECVGNIYDDITDIVMNDCYKTVEQLSECEQCCLFPYCITLKLCPETGRCSKTRLEWKMDRYTELLKRQYLRIRQDSEQSNVNNGTLDQCES